MGDGPPLFLPGGLSDRYGGVRLLGKGVGGSVYLARDTQLDRLVAIKFARVQGADPQALARFRLEARATSALSHPGVVGVYDFGDDGAGTWYIVYEYLAGESLESRMARQDPPSLPWILTCGQALAEALGALADAGLVHRDVKPANILLRECGEPVLCDLGMALSHEGGGPETETGVVLGTPFYLAPELLRGGVAGAASDQYALGTVLYELLFGVRPRAVRSLEDLVAAAQDPTPPRPPPGVVDPHPAVTAVVCRTLESQPERRFPDFESLAAALRHAGMQDHDMTAAASPRPPAPSGPLPAPVAPPPALARPRRLAWAAALGGLGLVGLGLWWSAPVAFETTRPPSSPRRPVPAATARSPGPQLASDLEALDRWHGPVAPSPPGYRAARPPRPHLLGLLRRPALDETLAALDRTLEALRRRVAATPRGPVSEPLEPAALGLIEHLLEDLRALDDAATAAVLRLDVTSELARLTREGRSPWPHLAPTREGLAATLASRREDLGPRLAAFQLALMSLGGETGMAGLLGRVCQQLEAPPGLARDRVPLVLAALRAGAHLLGTASLDCSARRRVLATVDRLLSASGANLDPATRAGVGAVWVEEAGRFLHLCEAAVGPGDLDRFDAGMAALERHATLVPATTRRALEALLEGPDELRDLLGPAPAFLRARRRRWRELLAATGP